MWHYIDRTEHGDPAPGAPHLPPPGSVYLAFDAVRWCVVLGYTERGGYSSFLSPNVDDDCNIVAFAPIDEQEAPDLERIRKTGDWPGTCQYANVELPVLWREPDGEGRHG